MSDPSKTESATPRRREDARKKGQVAKSIEATAAASFIIALFVFKIYGWNIFAQMRDYLAYWLGNLHKFEFTMENMPGLELDIMLRMAIMMAPVALAIFVAVIAINIAQVGFHFTPDPLMPNLSKINPLKGFANLFSKRGLENLVKSVIKLIIVIWIAYSVLAKDIPDLFPLIQSDVIYSFMAIVDICYKIAVRFAIFMVIIAILDYAWQRYMFEDELKMSKQEIKDEHKRTEGNPQVKSEIRRRMRQMMRSRMMQAVPKADVVVTNPTHVAVALQYDAVKMSSPVVVAKGARLMAQQIKDVAKASGVPIIENKPLARSLYQTVEIGDAVPEDLFNAVAEILTYVHKMTGRTFGL